ncbi:Hypothetical predicted protein [Octopus vulgaris]|uniref:Uncharacterized protein n=1 Tax=Octopus vulgaris TaxID=6645 RepID=A0AA36FG96_OCTVU|nr:Hypothetical predicted protein [Octopus vulgaris]
MLQVLRMLSSIALVFGPMLALFRLSCLPDSVSIIYDLGVSALLTTGIHVLVIGFLVCTYCPPSISVSPHEMWHMHSSSADSHSCCTLNIWYQIHKFPHNNKVFIKVNTSENPTSSSSFTNQ